MGLKDYSHISLSAQAVTPKRWIKEGKEKEREREVQRKEEERDHRQGKCVTGDPPPFDFFLLFLVFGVLPFFFFFSFSSSRFSAALITLIWFANFIALRIACTFCLVYCAAGPADAIHATPVVFSHCSHVQHNLPSLSSCSSTTSALC